MHVLAVICFDPVIARLRKQNIAADELFLKLGSANHTRLFISEQLPVAEMSAVMCKPNIVRVKVFPRPVEPGQLTVIGIFCADVFAGVILLIPGSKSIPS